MTTGSLKSKLIRMAHLPWGALFFVGGLLLVYGTDMPAAVGWITVAVGVFLLLMQVLAFLFVARVVKSIDGKINIEETYTTNYGRRLPRGPSGIIRQGTTLRNVKGDRITVSQSQKGE